MHFPYLYLFYLLNRKKGHNIRSQTSNELQYQEPSLSTDSLTLNFIDRQFIIPVTQNHCSRLAIFLFLNFHNHYLTSIIPKTTPNVYHHSIHRDKGVRKKKILTVPSPGRKLYYNSFAPLHKYLKFMRCVIEGVVLMTTFTPLNATGLVKLPHYWHPH